MMRLGGECKLEESEETIKPKMPEETEDTTLKEEEKRARILNGCGASSEA
jgi:hypothetical protein